MKKVLYFCLAALLFGLASCEPNEPKKQEGPAFTLTLKTGLNNYVQITRDTTIKLDVAIPDEITGEDMLEARGKYARVGKYGKELTVTVERQAINTKNQVTEQFCMAGMCANLTSDKSQSFNYAVENESEWYVHFIPGEDEEIVRAINKYTFKSGETSISLTIVFDYHEG